MEDTELMLRNLTFPRPGKYAALLTYEILMGGQFLAGPCRCPFVHLSAQPEIPVL